jgi:hypothetical protein
MAMASPYKMTVRRIGQKTQKATKHALDSPKEITFQFDMMAETTGFEPVVPFWSTTV